MIQRHDEIRAVNQQPQGHRILQGEGDTWSFKLPAPRDCECVATVLNCTGSGLHHSSPGWYKLGNLAHNSLYLLIQRLRGWHCSTRFMPHPWTALKLTWWHICCSKTLLQTFSPIKKRQHHKQTGPSEEAYSQSCFLLILILINSSWNSSHTPHNPNNLLLHYNFSNEWTSGKLGIFYWWIGWWAYLRIYMNPCVCLLVMCFFCERSKKREAQMSC